MIAGMICSAKTNLGTISQSGILNFFFFLCWCCCCSHIQNNLKLVAALSYLGSVFICYSLIKGQQLRSTKNKLKTCRLRHLHIAIKNISFDWMICWLWWSCLATPFLNYCGNKKYCICGKYWIYLFCFFLFSFCAVITKCSTRSSPFCCRPPSRLSAGVRTKSLLYSLHSSLVL